jgi:hypothetical protein
MPYLLSRQDFQSIKESFSKGEKYLLVIKGQEKLIEIVPLQEYLKTLKAAPEQERLSSQVLSGQNGPKGLHFRLRKSSPIPIK